MVCNCFESKFRKFLFIYNANQTHYFWGKLHTVGKTPPPLLVGKDSLSLILIPLADLHRIKHSLKLSFPHIDDRNWLWDYGRLSFQVFARKFDHICSCSEFVFCMNLECPFWRWWYWCLRGCLPAIEFF